MESFAFTTGTQVFFEHQNNFIVRSANNLLVAGNASQKSTAFAYNANQWYHIVVTMKNGGDLIIYLDGVQFNLGTMGAAFTTAVSKLAVGSATNNAGPFNGRMDDIRMYRRILSEQEVAMLYNEVKYNEPPVPLYNSPIFNFDEKTIAELDLDGLYSDPENQSVSFSVSNYTSQNHIQLVAGNKLRLSPDKQFSGTDTVYIQAMDGDTTRYDTLQFAFQPLKAPALDSILITNYGFNGNTRDRIGTNANLVQYYGPTPSVVQDRFGQTNGAYLFNNGILRIPGFTNSPITDGFSVSLWMKPVTEMEPASSRRVIYDHRGTSSILYYEAGQLRFVLNTTNTTFALDTFFLADQWYHIAVTAKEGGQVRFYIDGKEYIVGDAPQTFDQRTQSFFVGGTTNTLTNQGADYVNATLDDLRFYGRVINFLEVDSLLNFPEQAFLNISQGICEGDIITRGDKQISAAGVYFYSEEGSVNPDTLVELTISVNARPNVLAGTATLKVCEGSEIILRGIGANEYSWNNGVSNDEAFIINDTTSYTLIGTDLNGCKDTAYITIDVIFNNLTDEVLHASQTDFCGMDSAFAIISIDSSQVGYDYYLINDADSSIVRGPIAGTGSLLSFETDTVYNTSTYRISAVTAPGTTSGLDFDGVNDKVVIPYNASMDFVSEFTIESWIFPRSANYDRYIGNYSGTGNTPGDIVFYGASSINNGRGLTLYMTTASISVTKIFSVDNVVNLNEWNHIAAVFDHGTIFLYVNGNQVLTGDFGASSIPANTANWVLGEDNGGSVAEFFNGKMDDVRFWNIARTQHEIASAMNVILSGYETGLTAYYKMDEGSGLSLIDATGNNNTGTLTNMNEFTDWVSGKLSNEVVCSLELSRKVILSLDQANIFASENDTIMLGDSIEISASGGTFYTWDNGLGAGQSHTVSPLATTTYTVTGSNGDCTNTDEVTIIVIPVPQLVNPIADMILSEDEDFMGIASLDTVFTELSGGTMNFTANSSDPGVEVTINGSVISLSTLNDFNGSANINVVAENANGSSTDEFSVTVIPVNDSPVFTLSQTFMNLDVDFTDPVIVSVTTDFTPNESDQTVSYTLEPSGVTFVGIAFNNSTGELEIIANAGESGSQIFTVIANDGQTENNLFSQTFELIVSANLAPMVVSPVSDVNIDEDLSPRVIVSDITLIFNDPEDDELSYSVSSDNPFVVPVIQGDNLVIELAADYSGTAILSLAANDGDQETIDEFIINVIPVNDPPAFQLSQSSQTLSVNFVDPSIISANSLQPENESGQGITYTLTPAFVEFAAVSIDPFSGTITINPILNASGNQVFTVTADDGQSKNNLFIQEFALSVLNDNPTDIIISFASIQENAAVGTLVGLLSIQDDNAAIPVFSLVAGNGDSDNPSFSVVNDQLTTNSIFNFEEKNSFSVLIRAEDGLGGVLDKAFNITIIDQNDLPEALILSNNKIAEDQVPGTIIGDFSVTDEDQGEFSSDYEFFLVSGDGINDADNPNFLISGSSLLLNGSLDAIIKPNHFINVTASEISKVFNADHINSKKAEIPETVTITSAFIIEVSKVDPTGIQLSQLYRVRAYPNPSKGIFTVEFLEKMDKEFTISIFDLNGYQFETVIVNQGSKSIMLDLGNQKSGLYLMKIITEGHSTTIPLVRE